MSNPIIRSTDHFVLLEPQKKEKIVTKEEAIIWLKDWLLKISLSTKYQKEELEKDSKIEDFLENTCELEIEPGFVIKWFAVRINRD